MEAGPIQIDDGPLLVGPFVEDGVAGAPSDVGASLSECPAGRNGAINTAMMAIATSSRAA
jgi:hypothetical protein